jgi:hypothetical protein
MIMLEETCDNPPMVMVVSESRLLSVIPPCTLSKSGVKRPVSPEAPSAINAPWISSTLLMVIVPLTEGDIVMLPETVSQLLSWFASFWLEMVTLLEPIGNELQSWQDKQAVYYLQAAESATALCHALAITRR